MSALSGLPITTGSLLAMLEEERVMGEQSICAHQERNCRLRQVEKIGEVHLCSEGEAKVLPSNNAQMAGTRSLEMCRLVTKAPPEANAGEN
jgi:hypothetical protein